MGPHLIHNKTIKLMDSILRKIVDKRYKDHISDAHITLFKFFEKQPDLFFDTKNKEKRYLFTQINFKTNLTQIIYLQLQHKKVHWASVSFI